MIVARLLHSKQARSSWLSSPPCASASSVSRKSRCCRSAATPVPKAIKSSGLCNVNFTATRWHAVSFWPAGLALLTAR
ncbi:hypothetical protein [Candidatus Amarolinea dominans]|uniref:hypothetical protein n=1 Tax=Candidatus Amarolinea dominans TaxID=3140696 RepID=UPI0031CC5DCA